jgi:hypothetical protein
VVAAVGSALVLFALKAWFPVGHTLVLQSVSGAFLGVALVLPGREIDRFTQARERAILLRRMPPRPDAPVP